MKKERVALSFLLLIPILSLSVSALSIPNLNPSQLFSQGKTLAVNTGSSWLGFQMVSVGSFITHFWIGILAGFWLWLYYFIVRLTRWDVMKGKIKTSPGEEIDPVKRNPPVLVNFIAGRFWKIFFVGLFYAVIIQIPIINRVVYFVSLEFLGIGTGYFFQGLWLSMIVAFEIGFLPTIIDRYLLERKVENYELAVVNAERMRELVRKSRNESRGSV